MSTPRRSGSDDPVVQFVEDFAEAFRPLVDHLRRVWVELRPALEPLTGRCTYMLDPRRAWLIRTLLAEAIQARRSRR